MLRKTIIATAAAGMLAAGSLVASSATASASGPGIQFGGPGWNVQIGTPGFHGQPNRYCRPIVKTVKYWKWGRPHWRQVVVGHDCGHRRGPPRHGPGFPGWGGPGWGGGPGWWGGW